MEGQKEEKMQSGLIHNGGLMMTNRRWLGIGIMREKRTFILFSYFGNLGNRGVVDRASIRLWGEMERFVFFSAI